MTDRTRKWILDQIRFFRNNTCSAPVLPFSEILVPELVEEILQELKVSFRERIHTPFVTLCVFLWQVLSEDHSCREAVARLMGFRIANGQRPCSPDTNPYCRARKRLPEKLFQLLVQKLGQWLQKSVPEPWLFHGRRVKSVDGSTVSMPDTPANQKNIPSKKRRSPAWAFRSHVWSSSFASPAVRLWKWPSGPTEANEQGKTRCFAHCGAASSRTISCWPTACIVRTRTLLCSSSVMWTSFFANISGGIRTFAVAGGWENTIIWSLGKSRSNGHRGWNKRRSRDCPQSSRCARSSLR